MTLTDYYGCHPTCPQVAATTCLLLSFPYSLRNKYSWPSPRYVNRRPRRPMRAWPYQKTKDTNTRTNVITNYILMFISISDKQLPRLLFSTSIIGDSLWCAEKAQCAHKVLCLALRRIVLIASVQKKTAKYRFKQWDNNPKSCLVSIDTSY